HRVPVSPRASVVLFLRHGPRRGRPVQELRFGTEGRLARTTCRTGRSHVSADAPATQHRGPNPRLLPVNDPSMSLSGTEWIGPIADHFRNHGWARGVAAFDAETLAPIRAEIESIWRERRATSRDAFATHRPELPRLHRVSPSLGAFVRHPV